MGYVRMIIIAIICSFVGLYVDALVSNGEVIIFGILFFFIPVIYLLYKIYVILDNNINQKKETENISEYK